MGSKSWDGNTQTQTQDWDLISHYPLLSTDSREVKVGEYNAVADTLEIINDTIRFPGKSGGLLGGGRLLSCSQAWVLSELRVLGFMGKRECLLFSRHIH